MKTFAVLGISVVVLLIVGVISYLAAKSGTKAEISDVVRDPRLTAELARDFQHTLSSKIGYSPIGASGGSMTFRAAAGWTCDAITPHQGCVSKSQVSNPFTIVWDNVIPLPFNGQVTSGWTDAQPPLKLIMYARDQTNGLPTTGGVTICLTDVKDFTNPSNLPQCGGKMYVLIQKTGASIVQGGTLGLIDLSIADSQLGLPTEAEQYFDSNCYVHGNMGQPYLIQSCEHPGTISASVTINGVTQTGNYLCVDGHCEIGIE